MMTNDMESEEIKDSEMVAVASESSSQHQEDSVEDTAGTSTTVPISKMKSEKIKDSEMVAIASESSSQHKEDLFEDTAGTSTIAPISKVPALSLNIQDRKSHRGTKEYSSESSDFESDESSDSDEFFKNLHKNVILPTSKLPTVVKTKGELLPFDLPPVEDLQITENVTNLQKIGKVLHTVIAPERHEFLVVVESDGNSNPLDEDSVIFLSSGEPLGKIHDVFGSVNKPKYLVRFNKEEDIHNKSVKKGQDVFYSPSNGELTHYVLVNDLKQQKGSDASWKDNNEPPDDQIDYSDDEQEKMAKRKRRAKNRKNERDCDSEDDEVVDVTPNRTEIRHGVYNQESAFSIGPRNRFRTPMPQALPSSSSPRRSVESPQSFGPFPQSSVPSPQSYVPYSQRNGSSPQSYGPFSQRNGSSPQSNGPYLQRNGSSPQSYGPFSQSKGPPPQSFGPFSQSNVRPPQSFGPLSQRNGPPPQSFSPFSQSNVMSPQSFGPFSQSNVPSPQSFGSSSQRNIPSTHFTQSRVTAPQSFRDANATYQPFSAPPNSHVFMPPNFASSDNTGVLHQNPSSIMPAPQNNIPLQQQFMLQSQKTANFLSHPPPNYNANQNTMTFLHKNTSFTAPTFGALPTAVHTVTNIPYQSFANQIPLRANGPHNNIYMVTQPSFVSSQPCPTSPPTMTSPCPTPPYVLCPTPPPLSTPQGFNIQPNIHPPVLLSQTPPPTMSQFAVNIPVARSPIPSQHFSYF